MLTGLPPALMPVMPADGFFLFFGFAARELRERRLGAADVELLREPECALAVGHDRDLDRAARAGAAEDAD